MQQELIHHLDFANLKSNMYKLDIDELQMFQLV